MARTTRKASGYGRLFNHPPIKKMILWTLLRSATSTVIKLKWSLIQHLKIHTYVVCSKTRLVLPTQLSTVCTVHTEKKQSCKVATLHLTSCKRRDAMMQVEKAIEEQLDVSSRMQFLAIWMLCILTHILRYKLDTTT